MVVGGIWVRSGLLKWLALSKRHTGLSPIRLMDHLRRHHRLWRLRLSAVVRADLLPSILVTSHRPVFILVVRILAALFIGRGLGIGKVALEEVFP